MAQRHRAESHRDAGEVRVSDGPADGGKQSFTALRRSREELDRQHQPR